ncbi:MAG: hypothetical protein AB8B81_15055 [Halioglobus sp.]
MANRKFWLLKLVPNIRFGRWLLGAILAPVLLVIFNFGVVDHSSDTTPAIFFSLIIAYIIPMFSFITEKSQQALTELRPILDLNEQQFENSWGKLNSSSAGATSLQILGGLSLGAAHLSYVRGSLSAAFADAIGSVEGAASTVGALMVWMIMTNVISMLVRQNKLFASLGAKHVQISLLSPRKLLPFARVSISSSLAVIGALALFPLMSIESGVNLAEILPGAIATLIPLIAIFIIPVWPVHKRLALIKEQEMANLDRRIEDCTSASSNLASDPILLEKISPLISYRQTISQVSTWPFDAGVVTRLSFYLIIPPLTWAGAALIENLVDSVI